MVPGYVEWCKNCDFFPRIYVFGMSGPRGPLGVGKNPSTIWYVEGFLPTPGDFYKTRILIKIGFKPTLNPSKAIQNHVKLSFLSAALDPQEMAQRYWSYQGFMLIF